MRHDRADWWTGGLASKAGQTGELASKDRLEDWYAMPVASKDRLEDWYAIGRNTRGIRPHPLWAASPPTHGVTKNGNTLRNEDSREAGAATIKFAKAIGRGAQTHTGSPTMRQDACLTLLKCPNFKSRTRRRRIQLA